MSEYSSTRTRFRRRSDKAMLGGVCAGVADYFGFNLRATRFLTLLAFIFAPMTILAYIAVVILIPAEPSEKPVDRKFRQSLRYAPKQTMADVKGRFKSLDRRLARLEKYVTSRRYQLDQEFRDLERR